MSQAPTVSVLMPVYNAERYLAEAVESVLAQTFTDFELLVIDDGSTDGSLAILRRYEAQDPRVRLVSRPNTGYVVALNEMLGMARGEFLARMDADDVCMPERFERQVHFLREHPDVVCLATVIDLIDLAGRLLHPVTGALTHEEMEQQALDGVVPLNHPTVMMRKASVVEVGGYRTWAMPAEDLDLWLRLARVGRLAKLPETHLRYRLHPSSVSERQQALQMERIRDVVQEARQVRGLPPLETRLEAWRSTDRRSRADSYVRFGWCGFMRGDRRMAIEYALKAAGQRPGHGGAWHLLAHALLKRRPFPDRSADGWAETPGA